MSFRDGQRRYGHVPPVQYPVAGGHQDDPSGVARRQSFNSGDDAAYHTQPHGRGPRYDNPTEDELFLTGASAPVARQATSGSTGAALSGYHHQYQDPVPPTPQHSTYNPQTFAQQPSSAFDRSQSTRLPYQQQQQQPSPQYNTHRTSFSSTSPSNYTPPTYNPAAYASATSLQRNPAYHGYGAADYGYAATPTGSQASPAYAQSPSANYQAAFPQTQTGYSQPATSPHMPGFGPHTPTATYDPSQFTGGQYPPHNSNGGSPGQAAYFQTPYPTTSHIPVGPNYAANDRHSIYNRDSRSNSQTSPMASASSQSYPAHGLQRHPTNAPLPKRPGEDAGGDAGWGQGRTAYDRDQDRLMQDIEAELGSIGLRGSDRTTPANGHYGNNYADPEAEQLQRYNSTASTLAHTTSAASNRPPATPAFDDDDDPEGAAGVLAMQQAELEDRRFSGSTYAYNEPAAKQTPLETQPEEQSRSSSGSDFSGNMVDLSMLGGGYPGNLTYGDDIGSPPVSQDKARPLPSPNYLYPSYDKYDTTPDYNNAQMDYGGTGGLQPPTSPRLSFDEGDERVSIHSRHSGTESPMKDEYQDLFYHPGLTNRPLPAVPPPQQHQRGAGSDTSSMLSINTNVRSQLKHTYSNSTDSRHYPHDDPEAFYNSAAPYSPHPERSISLVGHSNTPQIHAPARSRTDATEERRKANRHQHITQAGPTLQEYDAGASSSVGAFDSITLPSGRKRRFIPSKLSSGDFRRCTEPWALSGIEAWVRDMADGEIDLREKTVEEALVFLFTFKVPTMNVADAEALSHGIVKHMLQSGLLLPEEEWVKFGDGHISGVLWQMTGSGCYAPKLHDEEISGRCYSHHCTRTVKKVDLDGLDPDNVKTIDWHVFYGLKKEDIESRPKKEVERQNILHEIVTGEEMYIKQLDLFRTLYRDDLRARNPPILKPDRRDKFLTAVFGKLDTVLAVNKGNLLSQLKYRQQEQGPWITGFSDIFREWIRKARSDYIEYATGYPRAVYMVRKEADRNILFKRFLEEKQKHKSMSKQDWTHFLIAPLQRLQRYGLLLDSISSKMLTESEEKTNLQKAIAEIKAVALECDAKVDETNKRVEMMELDRMLVLRPGFQSVLHLDHLGRRLIMQGELTRLGSKGVRWVDVHALLFDHYLILAKLVTSRDGRDRKYDVSKEVRGTDHTD